MNIHKDMGFPLSLNFEIMFQLIGWLELSNSTFELNSELVENKINNFRNKWAERNVFNEVAEFRCVNGNYSAHFVVGHNRDGDFMQFFECFLTDVCEHLPGTYGAIYVRLSESNGFFVYKIVRGQISIVKDDFFSPCFPVIED